MKRKIAPLRRRTSFAAAWAAALFGSVFAAPPASSEPLDDQGHLVRNGSKGEVLPAQTAELGRVKAPAPARPGTFAARVSVGMVLVPAVVTDRKGRPLLDLEQGDFRVLENDEPQSIAYFAAERDAALRIAFLLDVSGSMRTGGHFELAKQTVRAFLQRLGGADQAALIAFADRQVALLAGFSPDPGPALRYLEAVRAFGQTALRDAVAAAPELVEGGPAQRTAIVLLTDGVDNFSSLSLDQATTAALLAGVPIYCFGLDRPTAEAAAERGAGAAHALRVIAAETGGRFHWIENAAQMEQTVAQVERELRGRYLLGYAPNQPPAAGGFRRITVELSNDQWRVRSRRGYFAGN